MPQPTVHKKIIVGISISLSGKYRRQGEQALRGVRLWVAYANRNGGIYVKERAESLPVELIAYDDRSKIDRAKDNVAQLLKENRVDILLGPYSSALAMAVAPIAEGEKKILWNHGGASDAICQQGWRYLVSVLSPASCYLRSLPAYLVTKDPSLRRVLCLTSSAGTFSAYVGQGLEDAAKSAGLTVVRLPFMSPLEDAGEIVKIAARRDPHLLVGVGSFEDDIKIVRHLAGTKPLVAVAAGATDFGRILGSKAEGTIGPSQWEPEIHYSLKGPASEWFRSHFKQAFGAVPEYTAAQAFAAGVVIQEAVRQVGGLQDQRLREAAADLDIQTFYGAFRIDPKSGCQIGHQTLLVRWQSGKKVVIWPPEALS